MTSVCVAVLTGLGADAILRGDAFAGRQRRYAARLCVMVAVAGFYGVTGKLKAGMDAGRW
jgi:hypothetical protein